ncbi:PREDICTED: uncharacterized protein LOC105567723 [Vollenhovia emeryi]|uniref:uncharacterized protein LOC105567723 n=1 Tax=Vollenhovia emeryi TaxID=411798 RepID=UPI0005F520B6|nr:PREDICTED: uncharacterized protein LOC105567723 [Vollenhovia emeryi]
MLRITTLWNVRSPSLRIRDCSGEIRSISSRNATYFQVKITLQNATRCFLGHVPASISRDSFRKDAISERIKRFIINVQKPWKSNHTCLLTIQWPTINAHLLIASNQDSKLSRFEYTSTHMYNNGC